MNATTQREPGRIPDLLPYFRTLAATRLTAPPTDFPIPLKNERPLRVLRTSAARGPSTHACAAPFAARFAAVAPWVLFAFIGRPRNPARARLGRKCGRIEIVPGFGLPPFALPPFASVPFFGGRSFTARLAVALPLLFFAFMTSLLGCAGGLPRAYSMPQRDCSVLGGSALLGRASCPVTSSCPDTADRWAVGGVAGGATPIAT